MEKITKHPIVTVLSYTITIVLAVGAFAKFVLIDNIEVSYQSQINSINASHIATEDSYKGTIESLNNQISILDARITTLEAENADLQNVNQQYLSWLQEMPNTVQFFDNKRSELEDEIQNLKQQLEKKPIIENYSQTYTEKQNNTIIDEYTGAIFSVTEIDYNSSCDLNYTVPNQKTIFLKDISAGHIEKYVVNNESFEFILQSVDWISHSYTIVIRKVE